MKREEFSNDVNIKIVKKELINKFPFIKNFTTSENFEESLATYPNLLPGFIVIDSKLFFKMHPEFRFYSFLVSPEQEFSNINILSYNLEDVLIQEGDYTQSAEKINQDIENTIFEMQKKIQRINVIPDYLKLKRKLVIDRYLFQ